MHDVEKENHRCTDLNIPGYINTLGGQLKAFHLQQQDADSFQVPDFPSSPEPWT